MRALLLALSLALAASTLGPARDVPIAGASVTPGVVTGHDGAIYKASKKKKKSKDNSSKISIREIGNVKRGKDNVLVEATVDAAGRTCRLKLKYVNGNEDSPDAVLSDANKVCTFSFDVPSSRSVLGDAKATVRIEDSRGTLKGQKSITFDVK
ncbi:MAG: hypothetical protein IT305_09440 [Chloroflexi bacterium]|nr:hypothetical protein [Chloroflexota bacterium]